LSDIERLIALLKTDEAGEDLARLISQLLIETRKRDILLIKLHEIQKEMDTLSREVKLSRAEEALRSVVLRAKKPLTVQEITTQVGDQFRSLRHSSHASSVLNALVEKGVIGKFKFGHNYYFTSPREAVNEQLKRRGEIPKECSPAEIAEATGMPLSAILDALGELMS